MPLTQTVAKATSKLAHSSCCSNSEQICTHSSSGRKRMAEKAEDYTDKVSATAYDKGVTALQY